VFAGETTQSHPLIVIAGSRVLLTIISISGCTFMAVLRCPDTGNKEEVEGTIPFNQVYTVEEVVDGVFTQEVRVDLDGTTWIVEDDGVTS
jgi:hypothetical protein